VCFRDTNGSIVANVSGKLSRGNIQSYPTGFLDFRKWRNYWKRGHWEHLSSKLLKYSKKVINLKILRWAPINEEGKDSVS
jgi:hypothetical protein